MRRERYKTDIRYMLNNPPIPTNITGTTDNILKQKGDAHYYTFWAYKKVVDVDHFCNNNTQNTLPPPPQIKTLTTSTAYYPMHILCSSLPD